MVLPAVRAFLCALLLVLAAGGPAAQADTTVLVPGDLFPHLEGSGFCRDGFTPELGPPAEPLAAPGLRVWGSYCPGAGTGAASSDDFPAPARLTLLIRGNLELPGLSLALQDAQSGAKLLLKPYLPSPPHWQATTFALPAAWENRRVRIVAEDRSPEPDAWIAFSAPIDLGTALLPQQAWDALVLLVASLLQMALLALPVLAGCVLAIRRGIRGEAALTVTVLLIMGGLGWAAFALYFAYPPLGVAGSLLLIAGSALFLWRWRRHPQVATECRALRPVLAPLALCALLTLFVLQFGFMYGGMDHPGETAARRFSHPLPVDNVIPQLFAEGVYGGKVPRPLVGDYLSSDRPPLQAGMFLLQLPFVGGTVNLTYEILSAFLQTAWVLGIWAWLSGAGVRRRARLAVLATLGLWGVTLLNEFYVWPKLYPVAFLLALWALLVTPGFAAARSGGRGAGAAGGAAGLAAALAMLCHGGSAFAILGIGLAALLLRGFPAWRFSGPAIAAALAAYVPWMAYQRFYDPPGNRLLKQHLAHAVAPDPRSLWHTLRAAYAALPWRTVLEYRLENLRVVWGSPSAFGSTVLRMARGLAQGDLAAASAAAGGLRTSEFFSTGASLGVLALGPLLLLLAVGRTYGRRHNFRTAGAEWPAEWVAGAQAWLVAALTAAFWVLIMFGPATTIPHQGTFLLPIIAAAGTVLAAWALSPAWAVGLGALNALLQIAMYGVLLPGGEAGAAIGTQVNPFCAGLAAGCLLALGFALWKMGRGSAPGDSAAP